LLIRPEALDALAPKLPLRQGARVGSSAVRRQAQLRHLRPDLGLLELRGNVPTRVEKLEQGSCEALLLAYAGVKRLNLDLNQFHTRVLEPPQLVPAPAQGALALECRPDHLSLKALLQTFDDPITRTTVEAERGLMRHLAGGCQLALGASARWVGSEIELLAWYGGRLYQARGITPEEVSLAALKQIRLEHPEAVAR
jgi:hydroxymethylbilane synthase